MKRWTEQLVGDYHSGAGYLLRLTLAGQALTDGDKGCDARVGLGRALVAAKARLGRRCSVHPRRERDEHTIGTAPEVLLARWEKLAYCWHR